MQASHATFEMAYTLPQGVDDLVPSLVLIGVPDTKALLKVISKLKEHNIDHSTFYESDDDLGLTAVATVPLEEGQRAALRNYKLWKEENNKFSHPCSSVVRASSSQEDEGRLFESVHGYQWEGSSAMQEA